MVNCLANRTQIVTDQNPESLFGSFNNTFVEIAQHKAIKDNCLAVDGETQSIFSYNCTQPLNYVCQRRNEIFFLNFLL